MVIVHGDQVHYIIISYKSTVMALLVAGLANISRITTLVNIRDFIFTNPLAS